MEQTSPAVVPVRVEPVAPSMFRRVGTSKIAKYVIILLLLAGAAWAVVWGSQYRLQIYANTNGLHWGDAYNAHMYGRGSMTYGIFHMYGPMFDAQRANASVLSDGRTRPAMDYPPLRLMVVGGWARWSERNGVRNGLDYSGSGSDVIIPMLRINTASELISSILAFLLIRMWSVRAANARLPDGISPPWWCGVPSGCIGAMLMWFNPGLLWNSYAFPQWDTWIIPFFLAAVLLACVEWWFAAGALIAIGALLKGQMLIAAPLFILWPLFRWKWDAAVRWTCGFAIASAAVILPFMEPSKVAITAFILAVAGLGFSVPFVLRMKFNYIVYIVLGLVAGLLAWPWQSQESTWLRIVPLGVVCVAWLLRYVPPRIIPHVYALAAAVLVFMLLPLFNLSDRWYMVGFKYGTEKFPIVATAGTNNLPAILTRYFQIGGGGEGNSHAIVDVWLLGKTEIRNVMLGIYSACLLLCAYSAARHQRNNDPRFLLAMATPWICSFALLTQLNNRYLIWAAGMSALLPGVGVGMTLLGIVISLLAWEGVAQLMYNKFDVSSYYAQMLNPLQTNLGWLLVLAAAVYLYVTVMPRPKLRMRSA